MHLEVRVADKVWNACLFSLKDNNHEAKRSRPFVQRMEGREGATAPNSEECQQTTVCHLPHACALYAELFNKISKNKHNKFQGSNAWQYPAFDCSLLPKMNNQHIPTTIYCQFTVHWPYRVTKLRAVLDVYMALSTGGGAGIKRHFAREPLLLLG